MFCWRTLRAAGRQSVAVGGTFTVTTDGPYVLQLEVDAALPALGRSQLASPPGRVLRCQVVLEPLDRVLQHPAGDGEVVLVGAVE